MWRKSSAHVGQSVSAGVSGAQLPRSIYTSTLFKYIAFRWVGPAVALSDGVLIVVSSVLSGAAYQLIFLKSFGDASRYLAVGVLVAANYCALTGLQKNYSSNHLINFGRQVRDLSTTWCAVCGLVAVVGFTLKVTSDYSRGSTIFFVASGWVALIASRRWWASVLMHALQTGCFSPQRFALVKDGVEATSVGISELSRCGYRPSHVLDLSEVAPEQFDGAVQRCVQDISVAIRSQNLSCVLLSAASIESDRAIRLRHALRSLPIPVYLLPDDNVVRLAAHGLTCVGSVPLLEVHRPPLTVAEQTAKRLLDFGLAAAAVVLFSPLLVIVAALVKLDSPGPVVFRQRRNGFHGSEFDIYKFRTMTVMEEGDDVVQAKRNDPRVTRVGRLLRRTSIDELPQLFNILKGDMSVVGPRPHAVAHNNRYERLVADYATRHNVKPGVTGWAQVNGLRGETPTLDLMAKRVEFDLWYIDHWSFWLDVSIMLRTMWLVFRQPNAF
jgi:undecaprenyl-phosphate galactose phosphotransferase/putative colanic acid biosynthesis UDP-glucose lipid carrier transferase